MSAVAAAAMRIRHRELGLSLEQAVPLDESTTVAPCNP